MPRGPSQRAACCGASRSVRAALAQALAGSLAARAEAKGLEAEIAIAADLPERSSAIACGCAARWKT